MADVLVRTFNAFATVKTPRAWHIPSCRLNSNLQVEWKEAQTSYCPTRLQKLQASSVIESIKGKIVFWFGALLLPIVATVLFSMFLIHQQYSNRIEVDLANIHRLEAARIRDVLTIYKESATSLSQSENVVAIMGKIDAIQTGSAPARSEVGQKFGPAPDDVFAKFPLTQYSEQLLKRSHSTGSRLSALRLLDSSGAVLGETKDYSWEPRFPEVISDVLETGILRFGNAFRSPSGKDLLPVVAPVYNKRGDIVGALVSEMDLGPVVDAVVEHEGFGETSEAHIAQPTADGDAEFITLMRFAREAAFNMVVPESRNLPINWSLVSPRRRVVKSPDYRSEPSFLAIQTLPETHWGLVVKIDQKEAMAPVYEIGRLLLYLLVGIVTLSLLFSLKFLIPLANRLHATSVAARHIAKGNYQTSLADDSRDELGDVGRSIDFLARNLREERLKRRRVEDELRHRASHDGLTGLINRRTLTAVLKKRSEKLIRAPVTLLFVDLDNFKPINDSHGHAAGDALLKVVAQRLQNIILNSGLVARWGGDEFVIALMQSDKNTVDKWVADISTEIGKPVTFEGKQLHVDSSIGVAISNSNTSIEDLINQADSSMYGIKQQKSGSRNAA